MRRLSPSSMLHEPQIPRLSFHVAVAVQLAYSCRHVFLIAAPEPINYAYIGILVPIILLIIIIILIWYCCCYNKEVKYLGKSVCTLARISLKFRPLVDICTMYMYV